VFTSNAIAQTGSNSVPATILVGDDKNQCPDANYSTIQAAVNAASAGEHIRVCAGTYPEQVAIDKSIVLRADDGVFVSPVAMSPNAAGLTQGDPLAAAFLVTNAASVEIKGFTIDGSANGIVICAPRLIGILFQNASGRIEHNVVRHFHLSPALPGCQSGNAIEVETAPGNKSDVTIYGNSMDDFQKNGITGNEPGTNVVIDSNVVIGSGPTTGAAQNGIQIGFGASGTITNNSVINNVWSPCTVISECVFNATGILVFESNEVHVRNNSVGTSQVGIFTGGNGSQVESNVVFNSLQGIAVVGDENAIAMNEITQSDQAAVFIQGSANQIASNEILGALIGILEAPGSGQNPLFENRFFATTTQVSTTGSAAASSKSSTTNLNSPKSEIPGGATPANQQRVSPSR
jgi:nitrous oxidase accessory protein NosD